MCSSLSPSLYWDVQLQYQTNQHPAQSAPSSCLFFSQGRDWRHVPSVKKHGHVSELIVRMDDSPALGDRASWQWEPRLFQLLVRPRGTNMGNSETWLEGHLSAGSQDRVWISVMVCFALECSCQQRGWPLPQPGWRAKVLTRGGSCLQQPLTRRFRQRN